MTYKDIYKSFLNDIKILERMCRGKDKNIQHTLTLLKTKLSYYEKELQEMEVLEKAEENIIYYTANYDGLYLELRRKFLYRLNVLVKLAVEIDRLISEVDRHTTG